jgi:predicted SAM-dependent methyltransferase
MPLNFANNDDSRSLSVYFRKQRFAFFLSLLNKLPRPVRILDIGGTQQYWDMMNFDESGVHVTLLNLTEQPVTRLDFTSVAGDATNLSDYADGSFDIVYSNSVIEHLFTKEAQDKMAKEVSRVGKFYFIQTPYYYFPIEPHWVCPFFQFLPVRSRIWLTQHYNLGHIGRIQDITAAEKQVREIQLLTRHEIQSLFPDAGIFNERILLFTKSIVAYRFA